MNIRCEGLFVKQTEEGDFEILYNLPSTRFNIHNEDDFKKAIEDSAKQVLLQIEKTCIKIKSYFQKDYQNSNTL